MENTKIRLNEDGAVLIVGPTCSGKTALAHQILLKHQKAGNNNGIIISHDEILKKINQNQSQGEIDAQFKTRYINEISDAVKSKKFIILDAINITVPALVAVIGVLQIVGCNNITILKMNIKDDIQKRFLKTKTIKPTASILKYQKEVYKHGGSLNFDFCDLVNAQYIIEDPNQIQILF